MITPHEWEQVADRWAESDHYCGHGLAGPRLFYQTYMGDSFLMLKTSWGLFRFDSLERGRSCQIHGLVTDPREAYHSLEQARGGLEWIMETVGIVHVFVTFPSGMRSLRRFLTSVGFSILSRTMDQCIMVYSRRQADESGQILAG